MKGAKTVDEYIDNHEKWAPELRKLRKILQAADLVETVKWGAPCYTVDGKNVVGMAAFSEYAGLWFHQGVFLSDPDQVLVNAQEGKTKALRQWRFGSAKDIVVKKVRAYVDEAIANQKAGKAIQADRSRPIVVPAELDAVLAKDAAARKAFAALTKGKQREYTDHVGSAKREATRAARAQKVVPLIKQGVGLHDKYRNC